MRTLNYIHDKTLKKTSNCALFYVFFFIFSKYLTTCYLIFKNIYYNCIKLKQKEHVFNVFFFR